MFVIQVPLPLKMLNILQSSSTGSLAEVHARLARAQIKMTKVNPKDLSY